MTGLLEKNGYSRYDTFMNYTYILKCSDNTLYTGWTNDLTHRVRCHNEKKGAKYTKTRTPVTLVYYETFETKQEAQKREYTIKKMTRQAKLLLIDSEKNPVKKESTKE